MIYILASIHALLQLFDWYSTSVILKAGGTEENTVMKFLFKYINIDLAMGIKALLFTVIGYLVGQVHIAFLLVLIARLGWVAHHNWKSL
jgi:hypothetical protein